MCIGKISSQMLSKQSMYGVTLYGSSGLSSGLDPRQKANMFWSSLVGEIHVLHNAVRSYIIQYIMYCTGELGYDGPLYDGFLHMMDDILGTSALHIKYSSYVYDGFGIWRTNFPGPIESVISKFTCISIWQDIMYN